MGHSRLSLSGGEIGRMDIDGFATAVLSGGNIYTLRNYNSQPVFDKRIEIICRDYDYNAGTKKLTGIWDVDNNKDGLFDTFNIQLSDDPKYTYTPTYNILKFTIIPEPATVVLLGLGGMVMRKRTAC